MVVLSCNRSPLLLVLLLTIRGHVWLPPFAPGLLVSGRKDIFLISVRVCIWVFLRLHIHALHHSEGTEIWIQRGNWGSICNSCWTNWAHSQIIVHGESAAHFQMFTVVSVDLAFCYGTKSTLKQRKKNNWLPTPCRDFHKFWATALTAAETIWKIQHLEEGETNLCSFMRTTQITHSLDSNYGNYPSQEAIEKKIEAEKCT